MDTNSSVNNDSIILVTGADGQLGKELKRIASLYPQFEFVFFGKEELPIHHFDLVKDIFKAIKPECCINCAAYTAVDRAEEEKELAFLINSKAPGDLASACKEFNTDLIHISTDYVFDGKTTIPYKEDAPTNPQSVYGSSKLLGEKNVLQMNPASIIIRTSWVYSEFGKNFVKTMLKLMKERNEINVVNDQIGSPTYAADLANAILQIMAHNRTQGSPLGTYGIFNYSNAGTISWYDFAEAIKEITGSPCKINGISTSQYPTPAKRPAYSVLDKTKIQQTFGIKLKNWKESLKLCLKKMNDVP